MKESLINSVNSGTFEREVLSSPEIHLVTFSAEWCSSCQALKPVLADLAKKYFGLIKFHELDVVASPETADAYGVRSLPTSFIFHGGMFEKRITGAVPRTQMVAAIEDVLSVPVLTVE